MIYCLYGAIIVLLLIEGFSMSKELDVSRLSDEMKAYFDTTDKSPEILDACEKGEFYTVGIPTMGGMSIPSSENYPYLLSSKEEAEAELKEELEDHLQMQAEGDYDEDDEYEGILLKVIWDGSENITLLDGSAEHKSTWRDFCGMPEPSVIAYSDYEDDYGPSM